jgi:hypothetical protein
MAHVHTSHTTRCLATLSEPITIPSMDVSKTQEDEYISRVSVMNSIQVTQYIYLVITRTFSPIADAARDFNGPADMVLTEMPHLRPASQASVRVSVT